MVYNSVGQDTYVTYTGQGWTDIYMDMRLGLTEVTMFFMVFGSLVTRRKPFLCSPSDDSVTAHNTLHTHRKKHTQNTGHNTEWDLLGHCTSL